MTDLERTICKKHLTRLFYYIYRTELNLSEDLAEDYINQVQTEVTDYLGGESRYESIEEILYDYLGLSGEYAKIFLP